MDKSRAKSLLLSCFSPNFAGMIELSTHIEYLLLNRDEVSIPGFGTFIASNMTSRRVDEEGIFLPPYRTVTFLYDEHEQGNYFIESLSRIHKMSQHEARIICIEYFDELLQTLYEERSVPFGSMGYLLFNPDTRKVSFAPLQSGIASPSYYGLDAMPFNRLSNDIRRSRDKNRKHLKTRLTTIATDGDTVTIRINRRFLNYVSTVAASVILFFALAAPLTDIVNGISLLKANIEFILPSKLLHSIHKGTRTDYRAEPSDASASAPIRKKNKPSIPTQTSPLPSKKAEYIIVLASAISKKNAVSFATQLQKQGYNAIACEYDGMVRVVIPGFSSQDVAFDQIRRMRSDNKDFDGAWACKVKSEMKILD